MSDWCNYDLRYHHPQSAAKIISVADQRISTLEELQDNKAIVLVVSLVHGPNYNGLIKSGRINGQKNIESLGNVAADAVKDLLTNFSDAVRIGFLMREAMVFVEYGVFGCLNLDVPYTGFHIRRGDKSGEISLPTENEYLKASRDIDVYLGIRCPIYLAGNELDITQIKVFSRKEDR